jgi:hypothetical protein
VVKDEKGAKEKQEIRIQALRISYLLLLTSGSYLYKLPFKEDLPY